jgi:hypothetical protein
MLIGFAALAIDLGYVSVVQTELQTAADASALAGASGLLDPIRFKESTTQDMLVAIAKERANEYASKNCAEGKTLTLTSSDILVGLLAHPLNLHEPITTVTSDPYNAVQVRVRKDSGSPNGSVSLFFAKVWGKGSTSTWAEATAVVDDRISEFTPKESGGPLIPITVRKQKWVTEIEQGNGQDCFGYNAETGQITQGPDGIPEISIYPEKTNKNSPAGSGNFGLLNFENGSSSVNPVGDQIEAGISAQIMQRTIGSESIVFYDENGQNFTYNIEGTPGLKASLSDEFSSRLGDVVGFFIHTDNPAGNGSNCNYPINDVKFGRVLYVNLNGSQNSKAIVVQPAVYTGPELHMNHNAPRNTTAGRIKLVR